MCVKLYDVIIIGGGVVGSAIARELARYRLSIAVMEKNPDIVGETSGRNSGVVHGGFAYDPGTLKAKLCVEGNQGMDALAKELGFRFLRCGKVLVGRTQEEYESLQRTMAQGAVNGATGLSLIGRDELRRICPEAVGEFAMYSSTSCSAVFCVPASVLRCAMARLSAFAHSGAVTGLNSKREEREMMALYT